MPPSNIKVEKACAQIFVFFRAVILEYEKLKRFVNFMVTPCINNAEPFYYQLMHIMLKNTVYLHTVHDTHALQVTICSHSTDDALHIFYADTVNQCVIFSQALTLAP